MVATVKFSQFDSAGEITNGDVTVGIDLSNNASFNNPWTFLPPGTVFDRPAPAADMYYRLRLNITSQTYEYYDPMSVSWRTLDTETLFVWNVITTSPYQMTSVSGYITNSAGLVSLILPLTALVGEEIAVVGQGTGGWRIIQGNNQSIHIGSVSSTVGSSGSVSSTDQYDSVKLVCITQDLEWTLVGGPQSLGLTIV